MNKNCSFLQRKVINSADVKEQNPSIDNSDDEDIPAIDETAAEEFMVNDVQSGYFTSKYAMMTPPIDIEVRFLAECRTPDSIGVES